MRHVENRRRCWGRAAGTVALLVTLASVLLLVAPGCRGPAGGKRERLVVGLQQEPDLLNPMLSSMVVTVYASNFVHGFLLRGDPNLGSIPDLLAEVPTRENGGVSADSLTWTLRLRPDATWHDGEPVTSADVRFTLGLAMDPATGVVSRHGWDQIESIETPDERTVVVRLKEPFAPFEVSLADYPILPAHLLQDVPPASFREHPWNKKPVGAGPFRLVEWVPGDHMKLEAYPGYFRGRPGLREVVLQFVPDERRLLGLLQAGHLDAYEKANTSQFRELAGLPGLRTYTTRSLTWEHVDLNCEHPALSDPRVRRALSLAVDRPRLSEEVYGGIYSPCYSDQTPLSWAYNPETEQILRYDPAEAVRLLEEAGWKIPEKTPKTPKEVRERDGKLLRFPLLTTMGRPDRERAGSVLSAMWRAIGAEVSVSPRPSGDLFAAYDAGGTLATGAFDMALYAWGNLPDPDNYPLWAEDQIPLPPDQRGPDYTGGQNHPRWRNAQATDLLRRAAGTLDLEERKALYFRFQEILAEESPTIPLVAWTHLDVYPADLEGFVPHPARQTNSWNCWEWR